VLALCREAYRGWNVTRLRIPPGKGLAKPETGVAFLATRAETVLSRVFGGKAAESQRLFRRRQETGIAQDCVVGPAGPPHPSALKGLPAQPDAANTNTREAAGAPLRAFLAARNNQRMRGGRSPEAVPEEHEPRRTPANDDHGGALRPATTSNPQCHPKPLSPKAAEAKTSSRRAGMSARRPRNGGDNHAPLAILRSRRLCHCPLRPTGPP
jgi:hypothetical protein